MRRLLALAVASLALAACTPTSGVPSLPESPRAIADMTIADEKAVTLAAQAVDTLALSASALVRAGVIEPGTPRAQAIARALDDARNWVNAAATAREAGNAASYNEALIKSGEALAAIRLALAS